MSAPNPPSPLGTNIPLRVHEEAAEWLLLRESSAWSTADQHAFDAWLAASPAHQQTWQRMQQTQAALPHIRQANDPAWRRAATTAKAHTTAPEHRFAAPSGGGTARPQPETRGWRLGWAPSLALASLALVVLGGGGFYWWDNTPTYSLQAQTVLGETRTIDLPDGSSIVLNVASSLRIDYYPRRRETSLDRGEAFFQVTADAQKPFTVDSGRSQVRVVGTAFNVKAAPPQLVVQVSEGEVEVRTNASDRRAKVVQLRAGSGLALDPATLRYQPLHTTPAAVAEWRSGQVSFRRTPLREVAAELSRYLGQPVTLASPELGAQTISAIVSTAHPEAFFSALPDLLPLRAQQEPDGSWRISGK